MQIVQNGAAVACAAALSFAFICSAEAQEAGEFAGPAAVPAAEYTVMPPRDFSDVKLATAGLVGSQSSVAVNPKNANEFLASYAAGGSCWVRVSTNAGRTWGAAKKLPMRGKPDCDEPAVTWAPDGSRVYVAYSYWIRYTDEWGDLVTKETGALVSSSTDAGATWSAPTTAAKYTGEYDAIVSLKLSTPMTASDSRWVYLVITWFPYDDDKIDFVRSADRGQTWSPPERLISNYDSWGAGGASLAGGVAGNVLIAWGFSNCDFNPCEDEIQVNRSADHGATFQNFITAVPNTAGYPAVGFGAGGTAHIVYHVGWWGDSPGTYYVYSTKAPYTTWSAPVALNDDSSAGNYYSAALAISPCGGGTSVLHAVWLDDRAGSDKYNVYYTRKVAKAGEPWSPDLRVGTSPVWHDGSPLFTPSIAAGAGTAVGLWGQDWDYNGPRPVWASRIASGVSCP